MRRLRRDPLEPLQRVNKDAKRNFCRLIYGRRRSPSRFGGPGRPGREGRAHRAAPDSGTVPDQSGDWWVAGEQRPPALWSGASCAAARLRVFFMTHAVGVRPVTTPVGPGHADRGGQGGEGDCSGGRWCPGQSRVRLVLKGVKGRLLQQKKQRLV